MVRDRGDVLGRAGNGQPHRRLVGEDRVGRRLVGDDLGVGRALRERLAECLHDERPLRDRNLHAFLPAVAEAVVGLVHRADVLQRDVVVVVEPGDDPGEVLPVGGFAAGFEVAAARLAVRRELRRRAVDEAGEDGHVRGARGAQEREPGRSSATCFGARSGVHPTPPPPMLYR